MNSLETLKYGIANTASVIPTSPLIQPLTTCLSESRDRKPLLPFQLASSFFNILQAWVSVILSLSLPLLFFSRVRANHRFGLSLATCVDSLCFKEFAVKVGLTRISQCLEFRSMKEKRAKGKNQNIKTHVWSLNVKISRQPVRARGGSVVPLAVNRWLALPLSPACILGDESVDECNYEIYEWTKEKKSV